jgi:hypothetical protein
MQKIFLLLAVLTLTACNETQVITTYRNMVVKPDEVMYYCPVLKQFPKWQTLTDKQVASTVLTLYKNNLTCKSSLDSIKKFLDEAEKKTQ